MPPEKKGRVSLRSVRDQRKVPLYKRRTNNINHGENDALESDQSAVSRSPIHCNSEERKQTQEQDYGQAEDKEQNYKTGNEIDCGQEQDNEQNNEQDYETDNEQDYETVNELDYGQVQDNEQDNERDSEQENEQDWNDTEVADRNVTLKEKLRKWAVTRSMKLADISELLKILISEDITDLPKDARTLLGTPKNVTVVPMDNGHYIHMGIKKYLDAVFETAGNQIPQGLTELEFSFNIDGTPISASGGCNFWPILGSIENINSKPQVFTVGIFGGPGKPDSSDTLLQHFVQEMLELISEGYAWQNKVYSIKIKSILCDAPALAYIKKVKSHGGYFCCTKCFIKGRSVVNNKTGRSKVVYTELNCPLRSNQNFRERKMFDNVENDEEHHKDPNQSEIERLPLDMVNSFPLDKMHLVDEGVVKKVIKLWIGKPGRQKLSNIKKTSIDQHLLKCYSYSPMDFQRKARTLQYANYLKASECRVFLLYTGPIVLKGVLPQSTYKHFISLSLAVRILTSPVYYNMYNDYAHQLLIYFVKNFTILYGSEHSSYNIHGLCHLAQDAARLGPLDANSCYPFEAYIKQIKKMLHSFNRPLHQCHNRITEITKINMPTLFDSNHPKDGQIILFKKITYDGDTFFGARFHNFTIRADLKSDNCLLMKNKVVIRVKYFRMTQEKKIIVGEKLMNPVGLTDQPQDLDKFFFLCGKFDNTRLREYDLTSNDVICKMCCLPDSCKPDSDSYFVVPVNHTLIKLL